jgi:hypothetical protein
MALERRCEPRIAMRGSTRATVRPGCDVLVIDLSAGGALVEAHRPLRPGARVHVQIVARERSTAVTAHVVRCVVWSLDEADGIVYRGALQFERRLSLRDLKCRGEITSDTPRDAAALGVSVLVTV